MYLFKKIRDIITIDEDEVYELSLYSYSVDYELELLETCKIIFPKIDAIDIINNISIKYSSHPTLNELLNKYFSFFEDIIVTLYLDKVLSDFINFLLSLENTTDS